ncbi:DUF4118 domain-containing protein [Dactylosporangium sp. NPDC000244]|uniref:sensor histidine kinase n=1 Tax=Dactylosporangium sp. NPDC000244 TaxID=3154365 RepID=UPI0033348E9E
MHGRLTPWLVRVSRPSAAVGIAVGAGLTVVETLLVVPLRQVAPIGALAIVYLPGVLVVSTVWGLWPGVATSIFSALAFDYFHTPPIGRLETEDWRDWLGLSVYLMVATVSGSLAQLARVRALESIERKREADAVAEMTRLILGADDVRAVLPEASDRIAYAMKLPYAAIEPDPVPRREGQIQLPLDPGALVVPADVPDRVLRRLQDGVVPGLATVLRAGRSLQANRAGREALLTQQAALRRVAVLVANGVAFAEIVTAVATEAADLFNADATRVWRWDSPRTVTGVAEYNREPASESMLGKQVDFADGVTDLVLHGSRPARMDSYEGRSGPLADLALAGGMHASVGAPIVVEGRVWGVVVALWRQAGRPPLGIEHELAKFTELVATAIANTESRAELTASRARLVFAADEARRGIERELHDCVQQRLISLGLELRFAEAMIPEEFGEVRSRLSDTSAGLSAAFDDLQRIVRGIHPALLSQGGLVPAVKALARRSAVPVAVRGRLNHRLPGYVEVAAYHVISEAIANSAKHADASEVSVEIGVVADEPATDESAPGEIFSVTIHDDGAGGADPNQGSGLAGLRDRVEALGGTLTVTSPAGCGTSVNMKLPMDGQGRQGPEADWSTGGT